MLGIIAQDKFYIEDIRTRFQQLKTFSTAEITDFYRSIDPGVKKATVNWRIFNLVQEGILNRVGRGRFAIGKTDIYLPEVSDKQTSIYKQISSEFPFLTLCLWSTAVINEFMLHQPGRFYQLVEVEKDATESLFHFLKDKKFSVYLDPSKELIRRYLIDEKETWIVKPLVTEAPTQQIDGLTTVTIEKLLVDIFCDPVIFSAQQGSEMDQIFHEAFEKYSVNESKMLRYARRRGKKKEINNYLDEVSKYRQY